MGEPTKLITQAAGRLALSYDSAKRRRLSALTQLRVYGAQFVLLDFNSGQELRVQPLDFPPGLLPAWRPRRPDRPVAAMHEHPAHRTAHPDDRHRGTARRRPLPRSGSVRRGPPAAPASARSTRRRTEGPQWRPGSGSRKPWVIESRTMVLESSTAPSGATPGSSPRARKTSTSWLERNNSKPWRAPVSSRARSNTRSNSWSRLSLAASWWLTSANQRRSRLPVLLALLGGPAGGPNHTASCSRSGPYAALSCSLQLDGERVRLPPTLRVCDPLSFPPPRARAVAQARSVRPASRNLATAAERPSIVRRAPVRQRASNSRALPQARARSYEFDLLLPI